MKYLALCLMLGIFAWAGVCWILRKMCEHDATHLAPSPWYFAGWQTATHFWDWLAMEDNITDYPESEEQ